LDSSKRAKDAAAATAVGITFDFGVSNMGRTRIAMIETHARYFSKGYYRPLGTETIPVPRADKTVVFKDLFLVGFRMPPHMVLAGILQKIQVQLRKLMPNAIF
jgi:hypothetical protein